MSILWHNDTFQQTDIAVFTAADRLRLGDGVFDTMLAVEERLIRPAEHFSRLLAHAAVLKINLDISVKILEETAQELLNRNGFKTGFFAINTVVSRGPGVRGLTIPTDSKTQIVMSAAPLPAAFPPVRAIIAKNMRRNEGSPLSRIKSCNYGDNILAMIEATERGANEAIMLNNRGNAACSAAGNIFVVQNGNLFTPPLSEGAMEGIMRKILIDDHGAREKIITQDDLQSVQGLYITNSIRGAVPVTELDGVLLPSPALIIPKDFHLE